MIFQNISYYFFNKLYNKTTHQYSIYNNNTIAEKNIEIVKNEIKAKKLITLKQIHSNKILEVDDSNHNKLLEGDGLITNIPKIGLGIQTADCYPVFLINRAESIICALHCGWRGTKNDIIQNAVEIIKKKYCFDKLCSIIGPGISCQNYEVDNSFFQDFIKESHKNNQFFIKSSNKILFDLKSYIYNQLKNFNVKVLLDVNHDTYAMNQHYYSHRRNTKNKINDNGERLLSVIVIN